MYLYVLRVLQSGVGWSRPPRILCSCQCCCMVFGRSRVPTLGLFPPLTTKPTAPTAEAKSRTTGRGHFFSVWPMGVLESPPPGREKKAALSLTTQEPHIVCALLVDPKKCDLLQRFAQTLGEKVVSLSKGAWLTSSLRKWASRTMAPANISSLKCFFAV